MPVLHGHAVLLYAVMRANNDLKFVTWLVDHGADVNQAHSITGMTALMSAVLAGHTGLVKLLLERGADVTQLNRRGESALNMINKSWKYRTIAALCKQYIDINRPYHGFILK